MHKNYFIAILLRMKTIKKNTAKLIDSSDLSNYILVKGGAMNHLKLQKLLYYVEAWHLVFFDTSIINDKFEAWVHGPVSKKLWNELRDMSVLYTEIYIPKADSKKIITDVEAQLSKDQIEMINDVINKYGKHTSYALENLTHEEEPWLEARGGLPPNVPCSNIIQKDTMKRYYRNLLNHYRKK